MTTIKVGEISDVMLEPPWLGDRAEFVCCGGSSQKRLLRAVGSGKRVTLSGSTRPVQTFGSDQKRELSRLQITATGIVIGYEPQVSIDGIQRVRITVLNPEVQSEIVPV